MVITPFCGCAYIMRMNPVRLDGAELDRIGNNKPFQKPLKSCCLPYAHCSSLPLSHGLFLPAT